MPAALELNHVWKKFHRGEFNDCLRDAIPALVKSFFGFGPQKDELAQKDFWALSDIDFKVEEGERLGFIGHNGAGKSTLLKILSNILEPTRGSMKVNGRLRALIEIGAGFHGDLTGRENIYLNGAILGMSRREIDRNFDSIVDFSGIEPFLDMPVKRYSSGMAARLGFAVAAHLDPEILIVDEVLSVGDTQFQKKCLGKMSEVANAGRTVLFVSHNMQAVQQLCSRAILLDHGKMMEDGPAKETVRHYLSSLTSKADLALSERTDREGDGRARITQVLYGPTAEDLSDVGFAESGAPFVIRLIFETNAPIAHPILAVSIWDENGEQLLVNLATRFTEKPMRQLESKDFIDFHIPQLLLNQGKYAVSVGFYDGNSAVDHLLRVGEISVSRADFQGMKFSLQYPGYFALPHYWRKKDEVQP